jgi:hypothetical protein
MKNNPFFGWRKKKTTVGRSRAMAQCLGALLVQADLVDELASHAGRADARHAQVTAAATLGEQKLRWRSPKRTPAPSGYLDVVALADDAAGERAVNAAAVEQAVGAVKLGAGRGVRALGAAPAVEARVDVAEAAEQVRLPQVHAVLLARNLGATRLDLVPDLYSTTVVKDKIV